MVRALFQTKIGGKSALFRRPKASIHLYLMLCIFGVLFSCNDQRTEYENDPETEKNWFSDYNDTIVKIPELNTALGTTFNSQSLGKPIGISGTPNWLITVGGWRLNDRNILLQGTAFKEGNDFFPNPKRNTEVEIKGPFRGVISYNSRKRMYNWLIPTEQEIKTLKYQRTANFHLVVLEESKMKIDFTEISQNQRFSITPDKEIMEWSVNGASDEIILLIGSQDDISVEHHSIAHFMNSDSEQ